MDSQRQSGVRDTKQLGYKEKRLGGGKGQELAWTSKYITGTCDTQKPGGQRGL